MRKRSAKQQPRANVSSEQEAAPHDSLLSGSSAHRVEREVQHQLLSAPHLKFSSLVIRRIDNGVCLEGVLESEDDCNHACNLAQQVKGVERVLNHLVISNPREKDGFESVSATALQR